MFVKTFINSVLLCTFIFNNNIALTQILVEDNLIDLCYNDNLNFNVVNHSACHLSQILKFQNRFHYFYCIVIDNRNGLCDELIIKFKGLNSSRKVDYKNAHQIVSSDENQESFQLLNSIISIVISSRNEEDLLQFVSSVKLNKNEYNFNNGVVHLVNQPNQNSQRYLEKCQEICDLNLCSTTKYGVCVEHLKFIHEDGDFRCVVFYKKSWKNKNNILVEDVEIDFLDNNHRIAWTPSDIKIIEQNSIYSKWEMKTDKMVIAIEPKSRNGNLSELKTVKMDGVSWYDEQSSNKSIRPKCNNEILKHKPLIAFGQDVLPGEFPWHVAIYEIFNLDAKYIGGGTIITSTMILTVAHMFVRRSPTNNEFKISAGRTDLLISDENSYDYLVLNTIIHEHYDQTYLSDNIALAKLKTEILFTDTIQPIHLSNDPNKFESNMGIAVGWGRNENNEIPHQLKKVAMPVVSDSICRNSDRHFYTTFLDKGKFCGGLGNGSSVCAGDSGGGLVIKHDDLYYIKGIVSMGKTFDGNCDTTSYTIFTDVSYYYDWIITKL